MATSRSFRPSANCTSTAAWFSVYVSPAVLTSGKRVACGMNGVPAYGSITPTNVDASGPVSV